MKKLLLAVSFTLPVTFAIAAPAPTPSPTPSFSVTTLSDSGTGSLRAAVQSANAAKNGSSIVFATSGTINLTAPLPDISNTTVINGATATGYSGTPTIGVNFNGNGGFVLAGDNSSITALSIVNALNAGVTLKSSKNTVAGNYIGLGVDGAKVGNFGDGIKVLGSSKENLIGHTDPVTDITYWTAEDPLDFTIQPVTYWQGLRNSGTTANEYLICGTSSGTNGLLYDGPLDGGGDSYPVLYPGAMSTSVYGPDNLDNGRVRLVGSYSNINGSAAQYGFVWEGFKNELPSGGTYTQIAYPGATVQFTHSTMGDLAVGNATVPASNGKPTPPIAYIYNVATGTFVTNIVYPNSKSNTAYGIWQNSDTSYTICGGYSPIVTNNSEDQNRPLDEGKGFMVDYDIATKKFTNWASFDYPNGPAKVKFITHFEGISSIQPGTYMLVADSVEAGTDDLVQGSWVYVRRNNDGTFDKGVWTDLEDPDAPEGSVPTANSVYGYAVVGVHVAESGDNVCYQANVNVGFQLSNVISGNMSNGISLTNSKSNVIAMNYIGTDPTGTLTGFGNGLHGILLTNGSQGNLIGGQATGINNPTGDKHPENAVFQRPPLGNLISGNTGNGVMINTSSQKNILSGNYIGTTTSGTSSLANGQNGVVIDGSNENSLIGCTVYENPFVFYNVVSGNTGNGLVVNNSNNVTVQANFLGMGADNATSVPNGLDGLLVMGSSQNTQVGGVIPLGNVISGNTGNGIQVKDKVKGFISFNTFGGIGAFQLFASPNGGNGILITSTGGNNTIRTCIISGNTGNGIEIGGSATGVQITDTSVGTDTDINSAIPNGGDGIVISGKASKNAIGGYQPSVEPHVYVAGNTGNGIVIKDQASDNTIYHTTVGAGILSNGLPNGGNGIVLDAGTKSTTIGGKKDVHFVDMIHNTLAGLKINASQKNIVTNCQIVDNDTVGLQATGNCAGTIIKGTTIQNNGAGGTNNIDTAGSTGVIIQP